jgi:hypothetical protein
MESYLIANPIKHAIAAYMDWLPTAYDEPMNE